jgi:hypothetical protein
VSDHTSGNFSVYLLYFKDANVWIHLPIVTEFLRFSSECPLLWLFWHRCVSSRNFCSDIKLCCELCCCLLDKSQTTTLWLYINYWSKHRHCYTVIPCCTVDWVMQFQLYLDHCRMQNRRPNHTLTSVLWLVLEWLCCNRIGERTLTYWKRSEQLSASGVHIFSKCFPGKFYIFIWPSYSFIVDTN